MNAIRSLKKERAAGTSDAAHVITSEIDTLTMKLNAVAEILMEAGGLSAVKRCGSDVEEGLYYLLSDMIFELRREVIPHSQFSSEKKTGGAS